MMIASRKWFGYDGRTCWRWCCTAMCLAMTVFTVVGCGGGDAPKSGSADSATATPAADGDHHHANAAEEAAVHTHSTDMTVTSEPATIAPGVPTTMTINIVEKNGGAPVQAFDTVHEKLLHMIVVSADMTWFNHVHPVYAGNGRFSIQIALPKAGEYYMYADYTPAGKEHEIAQHNFTVTGSAGSAPKEAVVDSLGGQPWIVKSVGSAPEGHPEQATAATYQVALMPMPGHLVAGQDAMLHFQVRDAAGKPLGDLEPYLGAMGHAVILSTDGKVYLHTHPMEDGMDHGTMKHGGGEHGAMSKAPPVGGANAGTMGRGFAAGAEQDNAPAAKKPAAKGADVVFHTNFPLPGRYRVWGQFQHRGKIITVTYLLEVAPAA